MTRILLEDFETGATTLALTATSLSSISVMGSPAIVPINGAYSLHGILGMGASEHCTATYTLAPNLDKLFMESKIRIDSFAPTAGALMSFMTAGGGYMIFNLGLTASGNLRLQVFVWDPIGGAASFVSYTNSTVLNVGTTYRVGVECYVAEQGYVKVWVDDVEQVWSGMPATWNNYWTVSPLIRSVAIRVSGYNFPMTMTFDDFTVDNAVVVVPQWSLTVTAGTGGTVNPASASGEQGTSTPTITAYPSANYVFSNWVYDGAPLDPVVWTNPLTITIDDTLTHTLQAVFTYVPPITQYTLTVQSDPSGIPFTIT